MKANIKHPAYPFAAIWILLFIAGPVQAQSRGGELEIVEPGGGIVGRFTSAHALVIGESEYNNGWRRLPGVKEDAEAITRLFEEQGFNVETIVDAGSRNLKRGIEDFLDRYGYDEDSRIILYFAGHGTTMNLAGGRRMGYIVPVDAPPPQNSGDFLQTVILMTQFETWAKQYTSRHMLFMFDSCFAGSVFRSQGSTPPAINRLINQPVRQFITSGDADEQVPDESIFRTELEHALRNGAADVNHDGYVSGTELGLYLSDRVSNYTNGRQNPRAGKLNDPVWDKGDFIFAIRSSPPEVTIVQSPEQRPAAASGGNRIEAQTPVPANMVLVEGGTFMMGSPANERGRVEDEGPQHQVTVSSFYMGMYEVTQKEYREVMGRASGYYRGDNLPVSCEWYEAIEYCNKLSIREGLTPCYRGSGDNIICDWNANGYRLPTEAEWEYAAKGGNKDLLIYLYSGSNSPDAVAWYMDNFGKKSYQDRAMVGTKQPNSLGIYDMSGNADEWCWDWYGSYGGWNQTNPAGPSGPVSSETGRVHRGGSWADSAGSESSTVRHNFPPSYRIYFLGLRLVRSQL
jgi:formylglycine-generating enzyme required for sulfatase activity